MTKRYSYPTLVLLALTLVAPMLLAACGKTVGETIDDSTITARVKTALINEKDVPAAAINVDTTKGVVTLSGTVKDPTQRDRAVAAARRVNGVKDVKSTVQINP
jgi:hyperosmotically inducible periplasmic protein